MKKTQVYKNEIKAVLDKDSKYRSFLFRRGYLISDKENVDTAVYPFYGLWNSHSAGKYTILVHKDQDFSMCEKDGFTAVMIGHAYDPFLMKHEDKEILGDCLNAYLESKAAYFDKISSLSGIHVIVIFDKEQILAVQDCSGIRSCYFGKVQSNVFITSHPQLVADLLALSFDPDVELLFSKRFYTIGNRYLPGNLSPFKELKRLGANTYLDFDGDFRIVRFYPLRPHRELTEQEYEGRIEEIGKLLQNNIALAAKKWEKPAISLSGGMDSKTTLACANGYYDKYYFYSFHAKKQEIEDAKAANQICERLGLKHHTYPIPEENSQIEDFDFLKKMINHNSSYISQPSEHEVRKFICMSRVNDFDIELKSWVSEIARTFLTQKYGIEMPKVLTERHFTIFQKRYFASPYLLRWADRIHRDFLKETELTKPIHNFEHQDLFYWEVRVSSWESTVKTMHDFFNLVTIPYNNRKLMEMFLEFPHDMRRADKVHNSIINKMNKEINDSGVQVHNDYMSKKRILLEKIYYRVRTMFFRSKL